MLKTILLLIASNCFMTYAWYGHLKNFQNKSLLWVVLISWGIAFFEYVLQVPANRMGYQYFSLQQLKIIQEVISMTIFAVFSALVMGEVPGWNFLCASFCLLGALFFIFLK